MQKPSAWCERCYIGSFLAMFQLATFKFWTSTPTKHHLVIVRTTYRQQNAKTGNKSSTPDMKDMTFLQSEIPSDASLAFEDWQNIWLFQKHLSRCSCVYACQTQINKHAFNGPLSIRRDRWSVRQRFSGTLHSSPNQSTIIALVNLKVFKETR